MKQALAAVEGMSDDEVAQLLESDPARKGT